MKKYIILAVAVVIFLVVGMFYGIIPVGMGLLEHGLDTKSNNVACILGNGRSELLDAKAYICSFKDDGFSEKIIVKGQLQKTAGDCTHCGLLTNRAKYRIYLKKDTFSEYEALSTPGVTSRYLNTPNPGEWKPTLGCYKDNAGKPIDNGYQNPYQFNLVGNDYSNGAIKAELWMEIDKTHFDDKGLQWQLMSSDEAYLYSGYAGLYLPRGIQDGVDRPYDTFEVGQEVRIRVETARGGYDEEEKPWRVTLNEPYNTNWEDWDDPSSGGGVVKEEYYSNDVTNGVFSFTVTEEMARKSMQSEYPYSIRIWNVLLPKGTLYVDFLDFIALAPTDVDFYIGGNVVERFAQQAIQTEVGQPFRTSVYSESDYGIDYFRVSAVYGVAETLLPSDPLSKLWLINTKNLGLADGRVCTVPYEIEIIPMKESFFTIHAKAFDVEGRGSPRTTTLEVWAYEGSPVPDEVIEDITGSDDYGGGETPGYLPWDTEGWKWEEEKGDPITVDWFGVLIGVVIVIGMIIVGLLFFKKPQPKFIALMALAGILIAVLVYVLFFTNMFL